MSKQADFYRHLASSKDRKLFDSLLPQPETELSPWEITERETLFNMFRQMAYRVRDCGAIVQNEGVTITEQDLAEWSKISSNLIIDLGNLLVKIKTHLEK